MNETKEIKREIKEMSEFSLDKEKLDTFPLEAKQMLMSLALRHLKFLELMDKITDILDMMSGTLIKVVSLAEENESWIEKVVRKVGNSSEVTD